VVWEVGGGNPASYPICKPLSTLKRIDAAGRFECIWFSKRV